MREITDMVGSLWLRTFADQNDLWMVVTIPPHFYSLVPLKSKHEAYLLSSEHDVFVARWNEVRKRFKYVGTIEDLDIESFIQEKLLDTQKQ